MKWIKQAFQRIFSHNSQDIPGNELTHAHNLPELTNADLEFLFTQLLEGVSQARGQQWALRYLQRMENRISEQRWLEWLQMFGSRVLNSPASNDELAFQMVQLGELNIGAVGEYAGNIGMQLLARTTNPAEWETNDIFNVQESEISEQGLERQISQSHFQANQVDGSVDFVPNEAEVGVEIPVPQVDQNANNIFFDFNFQPVNNQQYEWEINPEENALISLESTPGQDLLRQFGDELWEVGIEEPTTPVNPSQHDSVNNADDAALSGLEPTLSETSTTQFEAVQLDDEGLAFVEFVSPTWDSSTSTNSTNETFADDVEFVIDEDRRELTEITNHEVISNEIISNEINAALENLEAVPENQQIPTDTHTEIAASLTTDFNADISVSPSSTDEIQDLESQTDLNQTSDWQNQAEEINYQISQPSQLSDSEVTISEQTQDWIVADQLEENLHENLTLRDEELTAAETELEPELETNLENNFTDMVADGEFATETPADIQEDIPESIAEEFSHQQNINTGGNEIIETPNINITNTPIWPQEWTGVESDVTVTLEELWVRLQQSTNLVEQLAAGLVNNQSGLPDVFDTTNQPISVEAQAQKLFYQGLQQSKNGDLEAAIASYNAALELQPDAYEYWFNRGLALFYCGDLMAALASYEQAIAIKDDYYKAWLNHGGTLGELEQFEAAIASFDRAIALKSDEYDAWSGRGTALLKLGRIEEAIQSYDIATQLQPDDGQTWFYRGVALANLGEYPDAIASFDEALETESDYHLIWHQRGIAQVNINQWDEAIISYNQALELAPNDPDIWIARAYALQQNQQIADAIASYTQALTINPQLEQIWIDKGVLQASLGQWQEAIQSWDTAIQISPQLYLAWFNKAIAWDNLGDGNQALVCYNQALDIEPNFQVGWYNRGLLLTKQQQWEAAILSYDLAIQIQPDYWEAWQARASVAFQSPGYDTYFTSYSALANSNPSLNLRGYDGKITTYTEALTYLSPETHSEGWGKINLALGNTYYERGLSHRHPRHDWYHAFDAYNQARITLTPEVFPESHLEVLQNLIKIYVAFEQTADANALYEHARTFLGELIADPQRPNSDKQSLALKFVGIGQLGVDIAVQSGELVQALEIGEYFKNACLEWLLSGWNEQILSPNHATIQQLVNPTTAIIYWHISPIAIHTFIIKHLHPEPIPVFTPIFNIDEYDETPLPESVERFVKFRLWLEEWQQQYQEYLTLAPAAKLGHTWLVDMLTRLQQLKQILSIGNIIQELEGITQLILIPHRDLLTVPLHALFHLDDNLDDSHEIDRENPQHKLEITYLPTAKNGLNQSLQPNWQQQNPTLLTLENYTDLQEIADKFTRLESDIISQLFPSQRWQYTNRKASVSTETPTQILTAINNNFEILHIHSQISEYPQNPDQSTIQISDTHTIQISDISHQYQLITLTTPQPQTDLTPINSEYAGIAIALHQQGNSHIVNHLWEIEATTRILIMVEFYRYLQAGKPPITALNNAINWLKEITAHDLQQWYESLLSTSLPAYVTTHLYQTNQIHPDTKLYNHPFYWGSFRVIGGFTDIE